MKILILGSEGFIGSHLVHHFLKKGFEVHGCDLTAYHADDYIYYKVSVLSHDFEAVFSNGNFEVCINASGSGNVAYSFQQPFSDFESNTLAVARVLDTIRKYKPSCKFVQISSAAVYGNPQTLPVEERHPLSPVSPYGYHKQLSEEICSSYHRLFNIPVAVVRPFSVYGAGLKKQLLWDICQKLSHADAITLFGTGNETRDFIHISDFVQAMDCVVQHSSFEMNIYNLGTATATTIKAVADITVHAFSSYKKIAFSGEIKAGDPLHWQACITAIGTLGFTPAVNLHTGIEAYVEWFKKNC